jgi:hypothetical protein
MNVFVYDESIKQSQTKNKIWHQQQRPSFFQISESQIQ